MTSLEALRHELAAGDFITVVPAVGPPVAGRLMRLGSVDLDIRPVDTRRAGSRDVTFALDALRSLERPRDSARNGAAHGAGVNAFRHYRNGVYDALLAAGSDPATVEADIQRQLPGTEVICLGQRLSLFKQVGSPAQLEAAYHVSALTGSHGIGHTRLSTESRGRASCE